MPQVSGRTRFRFSRQSLIGLWTALSVLLGSNLSVVIAQGPIPPTTIRQPAATQPTAPQPTALRADGVPLDVALNTRGDLSLQGATIEKALFTIGASWGVNIVVGKDVTGTVSCIYRQAPLREVLDAILLANGYSYRAVGDSLVVQKRQDVGSANPLYESASIEITHSDVQELLEGARLLLSKEGQIRALESAKSIIVVDYVDRVASIRQFVARMDAAAAKETGGIPAETFQRLQVMYFPIQYVPVDSVREPITAVLSSVGRVATMPAENRLVVVDYASNLAMVRRVIERIDRPVPQVRISALIYDISLQDVEELGLNWSSAGKGNNLDAAGVPQQALALDTTTLQAFTPGSPGGTAVVRSLTRNFDIVTVLQLLQNANDARLLANPSVTVMENETADMSSVQQIPFQQITQSELGGQLGTTQFKDVGITLQVTPTIAADGTVKLEVDQEFSRIAGFTENDNQPIIDTRIANTVVRVANRRTLVIGGLRQRSDTGDFNGIPLLKDIKYFGALFRSRNTTVRESELVVFLMPEIVSYAQAPSCRESLAEQTIRCRLDRVPMAEGCGGPNDGNCNQGTNSLEGDIIVDDVVIPPSSSDALPPAFNQPLMQGGRSQSSSLEKVPLRSGFGDRYRAKGGTDSRRRMVRESNSRVSTAVKSDSRELLKRLRSE